MALTCRFYEQKFPEIEDVVMVNVRSIADMGAYVHLLEYNNIEGKFSQFSEKNKNQNSKQYFTASIIIYRTSLSDYRNDIIE